MTRPVEGFLTEDGLFFEEEILAIYHETVSTFKAEIYNFLEASNAPPEAREDVYQVFFQFTRARRPIVLLLCGVLGELAKRHEENGQLPEGGPTSDPPIWLQDGHELGGEADAEGTTQQIPPEAGSLSAEPGEKPRPGSEVEVATDSVAEDRKESLEFPMKEHKVTIPVTLTDSDKYTEQAIIHKKKTKSRNEQIADDFEKKFL